MSARQALQLFKSLSEDQKHFIKEKTLSATMPVGAWLKLLAQSSAYDRLGDHVIRDSKNRAFVSALIGIVLFIIMLISAFFPLGIVVIAAIGYSIYLSNLKNRFKKRDLNNHLRKFFFPLLKVLQQKAGNDSKMSSQLDFRDPLLLKPNKTYKQNEREIKEYNLKRIMAKIPLLDGSVLEFVMADDIKKLDYSVRNERNKVKYKTKYKVKHEYFIKLTIPKSVCNLKGQTDSSVLITEKEDSFICKFRGKEKSEDPKYILSVKSFISGIDLILAQFDSHGESPGIVDQKVNESENTLSKPEELTSSLLWVSYFDDYDYTSFDYSSGGVDMIESELSEVDSFYDS